MPLPLQAYPAFLFTFALLPYFVRASLENRYSRASHRAPYAFPRSSRNLSMIVRLTESRFGISSTISLSLRRAACSLSMADMIFRFLLFLSFFMPLSSRTSVFL